MFIVLNRQKIYSYIISIATVCMLFVIAGNINTGKNAITTSATTRQLPIKYCRKMPKNSTKCRKNNQQIFKFVWLFKITYDKMNA